MTSSEFFRAGVGLVIVDTSNRVLAFERSDVRDAWQLPQGGVDQDEEVVDAARRELLEETGIPWSTVELVGEHPVWLGYELPESSRSSKTERGQVHRWLLLRFTAPETDVDLDRATGDREFSDYRWMTFDELLDSTWHVRRPVYVELARHWSQELAVSDD